MMRRVYAAVFLIALLVPWQHPCDAQENVTTRRIKVADEARSQDLQALRQLLEQQSKQLETLTQQVAKLAQLLETKHNPAATSPAPTVTQDMPLQETNPPVAAGNSVAGPPAGHPLTIAPAGNPVTSDPPKAEAVEGRGAVHTVAKGETLTSIARQYKISISELQKVNKIENDRKLQIGQTLIVPQAKAADTPPEKKELP